MTSHPPVDSGHVLALRRFNRFHTRLVGALDERVLQSEYSLPQLRLLYEIAHAPAEAPASAAQLGRELRLDTGYLSRLIGSLEARGLLRREASPAQGKRLALGLTAEGQRVFAGLEAASSQEVAGLLAGLDEAGREQLTAALALARRLLGDPTAAPRDFVLRDPAPGDLGLVVQRQAQLYAREYGWDWTFEACWPRSFLIT
jgi:DNA-binding MarR family transcriptional regulator